MKQFLLFALLLCNSSSSGMDLGLVGKVLLTAPVLTHTHLHILCEAAVTAGNSCFELVYLQKWFPSLWALFTAPVLDSRLLRLRQSWGKYVILSWILEHSFQIFHTKYFLKCTWSSQTFHFFTTNYFRTHAQNWWNTDLCGFRCVSWNFFVPDLPRECKESGPVRASSILSWFLLDMTEPFAKTSPRRLKWVLLELWFWFLVGSNKS